MSNQDAPFGFMPYRQMGGGMIRATENYRIAGTYGTKIYTGDVVKMLDTGFLALSAGGDVENVGVFAGCRYIDTIGRPIWSSYWPAPGAVLTGTEVFAAVYDDPDLSFVVQTASGVALTQTMFQNNVDMVSVHAGVDVYGKSKQEITLASPVTTTAGFRILGLAPWLNNALGEHAKVIVKFVEHLYAGATGI